MNLSLLISEKIKRCEPFCLARVPGNEIELFEAFSSEPQAGKRQVICKPWRADASPIYFFGQETKKQEAELKASPSATTYDAYRQAFESCMDELGKGVLHKVVLSRIMRKESSETSNLIRLFNKATSRYPDAFVYLILHPKEGIWMGASPEILLKKRKEKLESVSLAGTQPIQQTEYQWGDKERLEQAYVSEHIRRVIETLDCRIESEMGPETIEAGKVAHLKTRFLFTSNEKINTLLMNLHPTPAIAGLPTEEAIELIDRTEKHERGLYTGYIGVYDHEKADIYVNLRCMQVVSNCFYLYLGGGITRDSELEKEWQETEHKAQTLLNLLDE